MPYVKRTAARRISAVFDRPSRDAKERVRANDPELLKFLGLAPTQSVDTPPAEAIVESYDYTPHVDDQYIPPPAYDEALYDESQEFVNAAEDDAVAFESPPPMPDVPMEHDASNEDMGTEFSLPDDMPHDTVENGEFSGGFDLEGIEGPPKPSNDRARPEMEVAPEADAPPQSATTAEQSKTPLPPVQRETGVADDGDESSGNIEGTALRQLDESDLEMARITEDLIDLLIGRNIINFTDFPGMAQAKLITRRALRSNMSALTNLVGDEENIF